MSLLLRMAVLAAALWAAAALAAMLLRSRALTLRVRFARPAGRVSKGIRYALVEGMAPGAKESVRAHLGTWAAGVAYHLGLACAFLLLGSCTLAVPLPALLAMGLASVSGLGALCGLGLLAKRALHPGLRAFSCPDDYASNLLCTGFAALGCGWGLRIVPALPFLAWGTLLLLYIPVGKIRHCAFFAATRIQFGAFFGRRGVLPPAKSASPKAEA